MFTKWQAKVWLKHSHGEDTNQRLVSSPIKRIFFENSRNEPAPPYLEQQIHLEGRGRNTRFLKPKNINRALFFVQTAFNYKNEQLTLARCKKPLDITWSRPLPSDPATVTVSKDQAGRYFVSCLCEFEPTLLPVNDKKVGINMGTKELFVTSDGFKSGNPRHTVKYAAKLTKSQRRLAKKKLGGKNRQKAKLKVARIHARTSDCRRDNLHQLSRKLVNENQVVCAENLAVENMIKNPKLARHIADAGWGELTRQLEYKANWTSWLR